MRELILKVLRSIYSFLVDIYLILNFRHSVKILKLFKYVIKLIWIYFLIRLNIHIFELLVNLEF